MFRVIIAVTALAAIAAAQSELTSNDGSINIETREGVTVTRRQQISVFDLSSAVAQLEATNSASQSILRAEQAALAERQASENSLLRVQMAALAGSDSPLALGVQAIAQDMTARTATLLQTAQANTQRIDTLASQVATVPSTLSATVTTMTGTMDTRISTVLASLASTATALRASQASSTSSLTAAVNTELTRVNTSIRAVNVALAGKRDAASHMWVGSCSNHGNGGWREYCFNRVLHDSARPAFRKENDTRMRSILAGYYYTQFHRMNQTCNWEHTLLYFDGNHRIHTHDWQGGNSRWRDSHASMVYPLAANKQFWARAWNGCWSNWNTGAHHTNFFAMYMGAIPA